jgi:hypothetical protein
MLAAAAGVAGADDGIGADEAADGVLDSLETDVRSCSCRFHIVGSLEQTPVRAGGRLPSDLSRNHAMA